MTEIIEDMSTEILLENYIIHYLFHNVLLLKKDFSMSQLGELLIRVTFLRTLWIGLSYEKDQLPLKDIGESVQIISKAYEHSPELKKLIQSLVDEKLGDNIQNYLAILVL